MHKQDAKAVDRLFHGVAKNEQRKSSLAKLLFHFHTQICEGKYQSAIDTIYYQKITTGKLI